MSDTHHLNIVDVSQATFQQDVIQRSHQIPVIVDFWAPWCGPCRMLGPVLERLAAEPDSKFVLAKVNSDHNPQLSMQFGVRGIPAVKAFVNGRVVDEFVGAQPEPMVRQFIGRVAANHHPQAQPKAQPGSVPGDPSLRLDQARRLLRQGKGCEAQLLLQDFPAATGAASARNLLPLARFLCQSSQGELQGSSESATTARQAGEAIRRGDYGAAMYQLLLLWRQDSSFQGGQARDVMMGLFELLGDNDPLTQAYRPQLAAVPRS